MEQICLIVLLVIIFLLFCLGFNAYLKLKKRLYEQQEAFNYLLKDIEMHSHRLTHIENNRKKFLDPNEEHKNKDILDNMSNTEFLWFIKDRLALPFFCRMCERFDTGNNLDKSECQFKGIHKICNAGYQEWLERCNNLEGDMDANIE